MAYGIENDDGSASRGHEPQHHRTISQHLFGGLALAGIAARLRLDALRQSGRDPAGRPVRRAACDDCGNARGLADREGTACRASHRGRAKTAGRAEEAQSVHRAGVRHSVDRLHEGLRPAADDLLRGEPKTAPQAAAAQQNAPVQVVASVPLPTPRPAGLGTAPQAKSIAAAVPDPFEKLFGKRETGPELAYAPADGGVTSSGVAKPSGKLPLNDGYSAIYDITGRIVHLPDGTKLEAHSGLGPKMDDPRHVNVRMHGATPPHVYDLAPREALFHGVEALRLHPVGGAEAHPRPHRPARRTPICSARAATRTAAFRSRTTTPSCAPTKTARSSA